MSVWGAVTLFFALFRAALVQMGLVLGIMFVMHKWFSDEFPEKMYGEFEFESFDKPKFHQFIARVVLLIGGITLVLHMLIYVLQLRRTRYPWTVDFFLFIFEIAALTGGFYLLFKLDRLRLMVLSVANAIVYLLVRWILIPDKYLI